MLSENPPDLPCSSPKAPALKSDEKVSGRLALPELDPAGPVQLNQPTHFSIRDYAITSRSKNIGSNWPFSQKCLNLCFKHGVKNLLPPFEPPDLVRNHPSTKISHQQLIPEAVPVYSEAVISVGAVSNGLQHEIRSPSDPLISTLEDPDHVQGSLGKTESKVCRKDAFHDNNNHIRGDDETEGTVSCHGQVGRTSEPAIELFHLESEDVSENPFTLELAKITSFPKEFQGSLELELPQKKCRLLVKLNANPETTRSEDMPVSSSMVSDFMSSKVCPVCKTFSSTSNTTLNAHIDQCLSVEAGVKQVEDKENRFKVKPSRKRLMVDIYATAPHCTLEDLDRRNGSSWAVDLSLMAPSTVVSTENKRTKLHPVDSFDDDRKGAVYVDSNGTKICILSKLTASIPAPPKGSFQPKKLGQECNQEKGLSFGKKRKFASKHLKRMKVKAHRKKLSTISSSQCQVQVTMENKMQEKIYQESKKSPAQDFDVVNKDRNSRSTSVTKRACLKLSGVSKQLNVKVSSKNDENRISGNQDPEENAVNINSEKVMAIRSPISQFSNPSDASTSSSKHMNKIVLSNSVSSGHHRKKESSAFRRSYDNPMGESLSKSKPLRLKIRRSSGDSSYLRSEGMIMSTTDATQTCDRIIRLRPRFSGRPILPLKEVNKLICKKHIPAGLSLPSEDDKCNNSKKCLVSKKSQTHRKMKLAAKSTKESLSTVGNSELEEAYNCLEGTNQSNSLDCLEDSSRRKSSGTVNQQSCEPSNMTESEQQTEDSCPIEDENDVPSREEELEVDCHDNDMTHEDAKTGSLDDVDTIVASSAGGPVSFPISAHPFISEGQEAAYDAFVNTGSSLEENERFIGGTEAWVELFATRSSAPQTNCDDEAGNSTIRVSYSDFECMDCRADDPSIQDSVACLTNPPSICFEIHQERSCVSHATKHVDHHVVVERRFSESPMSAGSTISHPLEMSPNVEGFHPVAIQRHADDDTSGFTLSVKPVSPSNVNQCLVRATSIEKERQQCETIPVPEQTEKLRDSCNNCCYSGRENTLCACQQSRQQIKDTAGPVKGLNTTSNLHFQSATSSLGSNPILRMESSESPTPFQSPNMAARHFTCGEPRLAELSPRSRLQSTPNPVLRLMGKDLMVVNNDEGQNAPSQDSYPCVSSSNSYTHCSYLHNHVAKDRMPSMICHPFQQQHFTEISIGREHELSNMHLSSLPPPEAHLGTFMGTVMQSGLKNSSELHTDQMKLHGRQFSPFTCGVNQAAFPHQCQNVPPANHLPYRASELILIDDFPDTDNRQSRSQFNCGSVSSSVVSGPNAQRYGRLSCLPSEYEVNSRGLFSQTKHGFVTSCPRTSGHPLRQVNPSEPLVPITRSHFIVPALSPGLLTPTVYRTPR